MVTHRQIRAARALLGWSQQELADRARVSPTTITRLETGHDMEKRGSSYFHVLYALEEAGIEFFPGEEGLKIVPSRTPRRT